VAAGRWQPFLRTSLYRAIKDWERNTDLESTATILTRKRQSDGIELEVAGRITDNWEVFSGISYIHAEIREVAPGNGNPNFIGQAPRNTPRKTFNPVDHLPVALRLQGWRRHGVQEPALWWFADRHGGIQPELGGLLPDAMVSYDQPGTRSSSTSRTS
jgi:catecholate siderophore receptor